MSIKEEDPRLQLALIFGKRDIGIFNNRKCTTYTHNGLIFFGEEGCRRMLNLEHANLLTDVFLGEEQIKNYRTERLS